MSTLQYSFASTTTACSGTSPLTMVLNPSGTYTGGFLSKIVYNFPDKTITRVYTFCPLSEALTGAYKEIDSRTPVVYTFPGENIEDGSVSVITVSATVGPNYTTTVYTISATINLQYLTKNPTGSASPCAFDEVHLLKTRVWGPGNSQLFILETKNPNYLLVNFNQGNETPTITTVV